MADKQIRVTTDTSAIERFKVEADELYRNLRKYSKDYLTASEKDIDAITQKHQELANLYRELNVADNSKVGDRAFQRMDAQFTENNLNRNRYQEQHPQVEADANSRKAVLEQIRDILNKMFNKDQSVGGRPLRSEDDPDPFRRMSQQDKEADQNKRRMDVMGGMSDIASGNFASGIGKLLGVASIGAGIAGFMRGFQSLNSFTAEQYKADSDMSRSIARGRFFQSWDPTGTIKRKMDIKEEDLAAYRNNLDAQYHTAVMYGTDMSTALKIQQEGAHSVDTPSSGRWGRILGQAATMAGSGALVGGGAGSIIPGAGTAVGAVIGAGAGALVGGATAAYNEFVTNRMSNEELKTKGSDVFGKNMSEMSEDLYAYRKAAVNARNGSNDSIWQTMLAEKTFDLDRSTLLGLYSANRYQRGSVGVDRVASDLTYSLAPQVGDSMELATRLGEDLRAYTQVANTSREKGGGEFDAARVKETIQALQAKGLQGDNLTAVAQAVSGNTMSDSDMSRALIMQAATMSGKGGSLLDIQAELEKPSSEVLKTLTGNIWNLSGGNKDIFETTLSKTLGISASRMRNLRDSGALYDENGNFDWDSFTKSNIRGDNFNEQDARNKTTDLQRSIAATTNKKIVNGVEEANRFYGENSSGVNEQLSGINGTLTNILNRLNSPFKLSQEPKLKVSYKK